MSNHTITRPTTPMRPMRPLKPRPGQSPGYAPHAQHYHGFCPSCSHPIAQCVCHRECKKIDKELLVVPGIVGGPKEEVDPTTGAGIVGGANFAGMSKEATNKRIFALMDLISPVETATGDEKAARSDTNVSMKLINQLREGIVIGQTPYGMQTTVIGGGCCVHLSMEYMPVLPAPLSVSLSMSAAMVMDSQGTIMGWGKFFTDGGHHVKECVISTNPGAWLMVLSVNSVTRVRWCEIISC